MKFSLLLPFLAAVCLWSMAPVAQGATIRLGSDSCEFELRRCRADNVAEVQALRAELGSLRQRLWRQRRIAQTAERRLAAGRQRESAAAKPQIMAGSEKRPQFTLRVRQSIRQNMKRFTMLRRRVARNIRRGFVLQLRSRELRLRDKILTRRIRQLSLRRRSLGRRLRETRLRCRKLLHSRGTKSGRRIRKRISACERRIRVLQTRIKRLRLRISSAELRHRRTLKRLAVLKKRMKRQVKEAQLLFLRGIRNLTTWKATTQDVYATVAKQNKRAYSKFVRHQGKKHQAAANTLKRSEIRRIIHGMIQKHRLDGKLLHKSMISNARLAEIKKALSKAKLQQERDVKVSLDLQRQQRRIAKRLRAVKLGMSKRTKFMAALRQEAAGLKKEIVRFQQHFAASFREWTLNISKFGHAEFFDVLPEAARRAARANRRVLKRQQRRIREQKRMIQQRNLIKKLSQSSGVSARQLNRLLRRQRARRLRDRRRRFEKRVVKRVTRIQVKLMRTARKAATVRRRRRHIGRLRARLTRRLARIRARGRRLESRVKKLEARIKRATGQVKRLSAQRVALQQDKRASAEMKAKRLRLIEIRIKRVNRRISLWRSRAISLKRRRAAVLVRDREISVRLKRLERRMAAVRRRLRRQTKRLQKLVARLRRFVGRVTQKRLVRPGVIRRLSEWSDRIIGRFARCRTQRRIAGARRGSRGRENRRWGRAARRPGDARLRDF